DVCLPAQGSHFQPGGHSSGCTEGFVEDFIDGGKWLGFCRSGRSVLRENGRQQCKQTCEQSRKNVFETGHGTSSPQDSFFSQFLRGGRRLFDGRVRERRRCGCTKIRIGARGGEIFREETAKTVSRTRALGRGPRRQSIERRLLLRRRRGLRVRLRGR